MDKDLERFLGMVSVQEKEAGQEVDYFGLLQKTFLELKTELETNGNTVHFREIQKEHGGRILNFWRKSAVLYREAVEQGKIQSGAPLILEDGSRMTVVIAQDYHREDEHILNITKRSAAEEHEVSITVSEDYGLDEFIHPPKIKSRFDREDEERKDYHFEIIFRANKISTITRVIVYSHQDFQLPFIKQIETLDTSSFGVETPILAQED